MANLIDYVHKYGHVSFSRKKFNDLDNLVFSYLSYLDLRNTIAVENGHSLHDVCEDFIAKNRFRDISKQGWGKRDAYKLAIEVKDAPRYANVVVDDFVYTVDKDTQFGAVTFGISKRLAYVSFEGTDQTMGGWKEDCLLACSYPVDSHTLGIDYLKRHLKMTGPRVIVGGHSKGGNTALVSAMEVKGWRQRKIRAIYNNDGPGLRKREMESKALKAIKSKYKLIVPHCSIVGMLLRQTTPFVVKSNQHGVFAHLPLTWEVIDDKLRRSVLSKQSKTLNDAIIVWLERHNDEQRLKLVNDVFDLLYSSGMDTTMDLRSVKNGIKLVKNLKSIDKETRDLTISLVKYAFENVVNSSKKMMI